ncbi:uncharacterized protein METZ01_LOCUS509720, partial [marine metagenome]
MSKFLIFLFPLYFSITNLIGQETSLSLTGGFLPYEAYYVQSLDLATGEADVQLFNYLITSTDRAYPYDPPIEFHIQFKIEIQSPGLGLNEKRTLLNIRTPNGSKVLIENPVRIDNRKLNNASGTGILDISGNALKNEQGMPLLFELEDIPILDAEYYENMFSSIMTMGRLPDGIYYFTLRLYDDTGTLAIEEN